MAQQLLGLPVANAISDEVAARAEALKARGITPTLAIVRVGEREDDLSYERGALKRCERVGIGVQRFVLPESSSQQDVIGVLRQVNASPEIHCCLLFRPLPERYEHGPVYDTLAPEKDVDSITAQSSYGTYTGRPVGFVPCTAEAVVALEHLHVVALDAARLLDDAVVLAAGDERLSAADAV